MGLIIDYGGDEVFKNSLRVRKKKCKDGGMYTDSFVSLLSDARLSRIIKLLTCSPNPGNAISQRT